MTDDELPMETQIEIFRKGCLEMGNIEGSFILQLCDLARDGVKWRGVKPKIDDAEFSLTERCNMAWNGKAHLGDARDVLRTVHGAFLRLREDLKLQPYERPPFAEALPTPEPKP